MINKEMKAADLASVTGGGWKTNLAIGGLCLASGRVVPWAAISVGIAAAKLTYDLSYAAGKSFYNLTH